MTDVVPAVPPADPRVGTVLGGYSIETLLGEGARGRVYRARQVALDRLVALKVLRGALAAREDAVVRFRREAKAAATIKHPHLIEVFDFGEAGGTYYYAMELIEGRSLAHYLKRGEKFSERECIEVGRQALSALHAAHKAGVVHRDVEPGNLMLDRKGQIKLGDLGLAHFGEAPQEAALTLPGMSMGTPHYMSPEQAQGLREIDYRADFYGLGATLFHLAAGRPPFEGRNVFEVVASHLNAPVPCLRDANPAISKRFSNLIQRLMAKKPAERPQTHTEIYEELDRCREPARETAPAETRIAFSAAAKIEKQKAVDSGVVLAAAAAVVIATLLGVFAMRHSRQEPPTTEVLVEPDRQSKSAADRIAEAKPVRKSRRPEEAVRIPAPPVEPMAPEKPSEPMAPPAIAQAPAPPPSMPEAPPQPAAVEPVMPVPAPPPSIFGRSEEWDLDAILAPLREAQASAKRQTAERIARYVKELPEIEKRTSARADLDGALMVKKEREAWASGGPPDKGGASDPRAPAELRSLRYFLDRDLQVIASRAEVRWEAEKSKALPLLRAIEARLTRGGRLEAALVVRNAAAQVEKNEAPGTLPTLPGEAGIADARLTNSALSGMSAPPADIGNRQSAIGHPKEATRERPYVNSLGMKFVPVRGTRVLFSVWETRVSDFLQFVRAETYTGVDDPPFQQGPDHPVVMVNWNDAKAFCKWLSEKEGLEYRLPTGQEWSAAVGKDKYPWGDEFPPPRDADNLAGEEAKIGPGDPSGVIPNWHDKHPRTAPVGSYRKNRSGLYDMGGNVWEWCEDVFTEKSSGRDFSGDNALRLGRGGHWAAGAYPASVASARQDGKDPAQRDGTSGFRCVIVLP